MTGTLISLLSVIMGIIGANSLAYIYNKYSFGVLGNTIVGVFGSVFFIKSFGRLGFSPWFIMTNGDFDGLRLIINLLVSILGGIVGLVLAKFIDGKLSR